MDCGNKGVSMAALLLSCLVSAFSPSRLCGEEGKCVSVCGCVFVCVIVLLGVCYSKRAVLVGTSVGGVVGSSQQRCA